MSSCLRSSSPLDSLALSVCPGITAFIGATADPLFSCASNTDMMSSWLFAPELILSLLAVSKPGIKLPVGLEFWSAKMIVCQMPSFPHYSLIQTSARAFKPHTAAATWFYVATNRSVCTKQVDIIISHYTKFHTTEVPKYHLLLLLLHQAFTVLSLQWLTLKTLN